jgi:beta-barrel assembly-enhancing protease
MSQSKQFKPLCILIFCFLFFEKCQFLQKKEGPKVDPNVTKEVNVGKTLAARLAKKYGLIKDEPFTRYLNLVGKSLAIYSSRQELDFRFGILDTEDVNAFACPGGYVLITRGAIDLMENEAELASLLSHELSHVTLKHSGDFEEKGAGILDIISAIMAPGGDLVSSVTKNAVDGMVNQFFEKGRKKEEEIESDKAGIIYLSQAGYDLDSSIIYLKKLDKSQHNEVALKTHPPTADRITELDKFIAENKLTKKGKLNAPRYLSEFNAFKQRYNKLATK